MQYKNFTQHIGIIGKDVELHHTQKGVAVISFPLKVVDRHQAKDGVKERETWVSIVAYDKVAEAFDGKKKGCRVLIEGKLQNKKIGEILTVEVVVQNFMFL